MSIVIIHHGEPSDLLVISSLLRYYSTQGESVTLLTDQYCLELAKFMDCRVSSINNTIVDRFDVAINISPSITAADVLEKIDAVKKLGYGVKDDGILFLNEGAKIHYQSRYMNQTTDANLFQLIFGLADATWHGEGYLLKYYPRNRTKKNLTGVAIKDVRLRHFIVNNLNLSMTRLWQVPFKQNILKHIDEVNRCKQIVTDDQTTLHIGLALRKEVEFITPQPLPYKTEMFGCGSVFVFDQMEQGTKHVT